MTNRKTTLLAAAALAVLSLAGAGSANAAPRGHFGPAAHHQSVRVDMRHNFHRPYVTRTHVYQTLRTHRYVGLGDPYFFRGHYVVRSHDRFGRVVLVEINPWTGAFLGLLRV
jgi:hypothetical protein